MIAESCPTVPSDLDADAYLGLCDALVVGDNCIEACADGYVGTNQLYAVEVLFIWIIYLCFSGRS